MKAIEAYITSKIQARKEAGNFRSLKINSNLIDFTSNDYLGFAKNKELKKIVLEVCKEYPNGSGGARLLSGNSALAESIEKQLATFFGSENALLFNTGFDANYGLFSTLPNLGDTILYDAYCHASIIDGIRASKASSHSFPHNNCESLENLLQSATGKIYVAVESLYSMDGDLAPLQMMADLCEKYHAGLIVDEAHATGIYGKNGEGKIVELGLQNKCLARVHTFGKAIGGHGATVLGSSDLKDFLINYCRPFIFSTALSFHTLLHIQYALEFLQKNDSEKLQLFAWIKKFQHLIQCTKKEESPIFPILIKGNEQARKAALYLQSKGFDVRPILSPTVAVGMERIRICLHSFNTEMEIENLAKELKILTCNKIENEFL